MSAPKGQVLARNTVYNLVGQLAPLVVGLFALPALIGGLGDDRFGLLAIAWMFLGYFGLFDLGLSRALTHLIADRYGEGRASEVPALVWTTLIATFGISVVFAVAGWMATPWVVRDLLTMPAAIQADAVDAFRAIAVGIPLVVSSANLRGVLEARQKFDTIAWIRTPTGILTFAAPLLVLAFSSSLFVIVLSLVASRLLAWVAYLVACLRLYDLSGPVVFQRSLIQPLFRFGGWMTVSNVINPALVYLDRFLIGVVVTVAAVTYYATPWEVVTKLLVIPSAVSGVLFPAFSYWLKSDVEQAGTYYRTGVKAVLLTLFPAVLVVIVAAEPGLRIWLGDAYASRSVRPLQFLAIGVLFNGLAAIPFALLQGLGRPDVTAKLHAVELPLYAALLWVLLANFGITGAAIAWMARVLVDFVLLYVLSARRLRQAWLDKTFAAIAISSVAAGLVMIPLDAAVGALAGAAVLCVFGFYAWRTLVSSEEKLFLQQRLARVLQWV